MFSNLQWLLAPTAICVALVVVSPSHPPFGQPQAQAVVKLAPTPAKPASLSKAASLPQEQKNPLLNEIRNNRETVATLVDGLDAEDPQKRRQAAEAIVGLRFHYIEALKLIVERGYAGKSDKGIQFNALNTLADLRPSDPSIAARAVKNIDFSYFPDILFGEGPETSLAATNLLVRASTAAFPSLVDQIMSADLPKPVVKPLTQPVIKPLTKSEAASNRAKLSLLCVYSIWKEATAQWLKQQMQSAKTTAQKNRLLNASQAADEIVTARRNNKPSLLRGFGYANALDNGFDFSDLAVMHPDKRVLKWQVEVKASDGKMYVDSDEIMLTMALIRYGIIQRLTLEDSDRNKAYKVFRPEAQVDAVRVLGCLRSVERQATWAIWQQIREVSLQQSILDNNSPKVKACIRALSQIDIPAAQLMVSRIAMEWAPDQQQAAAFVLGKISGRYSVALLQAEIEKSRVMAGNPNDKWDRDMGSDAGKRLTAMLKLGTEKKWFEGEYYGSKDSHAYNLVFPPDETEAKPQ